MGRLEISKEASLVLFFVISRSLWCRMNRVVYEMYFLQPNVLYQNAYHNALKSISWQWRNI